MKSIPTNTTLRAHLLIWETSRCCCCCCISRINLQFFIYLILHSVLLAVRRGKEKDKFFACWLCSFANIHTHTSIGEHTMSHTSSHNILISFLVINDKHRHHIHMWFFYSINILTFYIPSVFSSSIFFTAFFLSPCTSRCEWGIHNIKYPIKFFVFFYNLMRVLCVRTIFFSLREKKIIQKSENTWVELSKGKAQTHARTLTWELWEFFSTTMKRNIKLREWKFLNIQGVCVCVRKIRFSFFYFILNLSSFFYIISHVIPNITWLIQQIIKR